MAQFVNRAALEVATKLGPTSTAAQIAQAVRDVAAGQIEMQDEIAQVNVARALNRHQGASDKEVETTFTRSYTTPMNSHNAPVVHKSGLILQGGRNAIGQKVRGLLDGDAAPLNDWHRGLLELVDGRSIAQAMTVASPSTQRRVLGVWDDEINRHIKAGPPAIRKALDGGTGTGAEWQESRLTPMLEQAFVGERLVESLFASATAPSGPTFAIPAIDRDAQPFGRGRPSGDTPGQIRASSMATAQRSRTIVDLAARLVVSADFVEDSMFDAVQAARVSLARALSDGFEDCVINGDTTATHQDTISAWTERSRWDSTAIGGGDDHRRLWKGLRRRAFDLSNGAADASPTYATILAAKAALSGPLSTSGGVVMIVSPEVYVSKILSLAEFATIDKFGPMATVLTGQVGRIGDMPVVLSDFITADMNASGIFDNATKTKSGYVIVNTNRFKVWNWRRLTVEADKDITRDVWQMVASRRCLFSPVSADDEKNVSFRYNI